MAPTAKPAAAKSESKLSLTMTRSFDAPADAVFRAWTDPRQLGRWIGPRSFEAKVVKMEARKGGAYRIALRGESGERHTVQGVYREFAPAKRLVFTWAWLDEAGKPGHESLVTIDLKPTGKKTEMTLRHERFDSQESRDRHDHGWSGSFDKLAEVLAGKPGRR